MRITIIRTLNECLRIFHRTHFPEVGFAEAATLMVISMAIALAQMEGEPLTTLKLAARIGMARTTLRDKLDVLISSGMVQRDGIRLYLNVQRASDAAILAMRDLLIEAAAALKP